MALREILLELGIEVEGQDAQRAVDNLRRGLDNMARGPAIPRAQQGVRGLVGSMLSLRNVAVGLGAAFLTGKVAQGFGSMITAASDAAEITNKFGAVFNEETGNASTAAEELAGRIGQSRLAIKEMTADVGALVKPLVGSTKASAEMAKSVTELAFDISSFENVRPEEAVTALRSALIGSSEPMLRFGVDTRQAALQQFALEKGLKKSTKEMTSAEITALRLELVQKRLGEKGAVGDATKTADGFANRLRALQGSFRDLTAELGKEFLPIANEVLKITIDLVKELGPTLSNAAKGLVFIFRILANVAKGIAGAFDGLNGVLFLTSLAVGGLAVAFKLVGTAGVVAGIKAAGAWILATAPILLMIVLIGIIIAAIALLIEDFVAMGEGAESVTGTMIQGFNDLVEEVGSVPDAIFEMLATAFEFWAKFFQDTLGLNDEFIDNMTATLRDAWKTTIEFWSGLFDKFIGGITGAFETVSDFVTGIFGDDEESTGPRRPASVARAVAGDQGPGRNLSRIGRTAAEVSRPGTNIAGVSPTAVPASGVGGATIVNQPRTDVKVEISGAQMRGTPDEIGDTVAIKVEEALERRDRQMLNAFTTAAEDGG